MRIDIPGKGLIHFEGVSLPEEAKYYEYASFYGSLSDETREWVLDLRNAWGRERKAPSALVLKACDELEGRIYSDRELLFADLRETFKDATPAEVCQQWLSAIQSMRGCAETRSECRWIIHPENGEVEYFLNHVIGLIRSIEQAQSVVLLSKELEEHIRNYPETDQIRVIRNLTDLLSEQSPKD